MRSFAFFTVIAVLIFTTSTPHAQVLYTLASPYQEEIGYFGLAVSGAGNTNSDFYDDIVVGAPSETYIYPMAGSAYIYAGATGESIRTLLSPNPKNGGNFGRSVSGAGDINSDGYDDVIVGAPYEDDVYVSTGRAYVFSGQTGGVLRSLFSVMEETYGNFGWSVSGAGDVNSDGYDDVIVGAPHEGSGTYPWDTGRAYIYSGQTGNILHAPLQVATAQDSFYFGWSVSGAGDVNSDGYDDVIVGAHGADNTEDHSGRAYIFTGQYGTVIRTLISPYQENYGVFGYSVSGAGDVNSDGYDDVIVGAPGESYIYGNAGTAYVFSGLTGGYLHVLVSPNPEYGGSFGNSVSGAGDVNLDGYDDVVIGASWEDPGTSPDRAGRAYIFSGQNGSLLRMLVSSNQEDSGYFGCSVSGAGDNNSSGYSEVIVGAMYEDPGSAPNRAGRAYLFSHAPQQMTLNIARPDANHVLHWSTAMGHVVGYWIYGAPNNFYFEPGILPPHQHRLAAVPPNIDEWQTGLGIGDPNWNLSFLVVAMDCTEQAILGMTNHVGELDRVWQLP